MESKKRDSSLVPVLVAIVTLIGLSIWYQYLGEYTITKVDSALGIDESLKINDIVIEKGFNEDLGLKRPEIKISYSTSRVSESYVKVNDVISDKLVSKTFHKTITLSRDFFGKDVQIEIDAVDPQGNQAKMTRTISIPEDNEAVIAVMNT